MHTQSPTVSPTCRICDSGALRLRKKFRMSLPVVLIGIMFLIPSVFGVLLGTVSLVSTVVIGVQATRNAETEVRQILRNAQVPAHVADKVVAMEQLSREERNALNGRQRDAVMRAESRYMGTALGSAMTGGFSLAIIIGSFTGGLLGWLLIMRKKVLQCTHCDATVEAG